MSCSYKFSPKPCTNPTIYNDAICRSRHGQPPKKPKIPRCEVGGCKRPIKGRCHIHKISENLYSYDE